VPDSTRARGEGRAFARGKVWAVIDFLRQLRDGIVEAWGQLSLSARVNIALSAAGVTGAILLLVFFSARPDYVTLSSGLDAEQVASVVGLLEENGQAYRIANNNSTILVPLSQRSEIQLLLATNNLQVGPKVAPGFEIFAESELMSNQWLQDVKFMRAVQGELQRQLNAFEFVDYSYVLIREAKEELFVRDQKPSEAAVTLAARRPLTKQEVQAVVNIVAHAGGPNLHPGNITVTTTKGEVLHMPAQSEYAALASSKLEYIAELERMRERRLTTLLGEMGVRGTARVSAQVDFDKTEVTDNKVAEGTELSTFTTSTTITSTERLPEGAPGAFANVPEASETAGTNTSEETTEEIINFEPSRTTTRTQTDPGDVVKYIVSLVVEGSYEDATGPDGEATRQYAGLSETDRSKFEAIALAAVGEGKMPTEVTIHDHPFDIAQLGAAGQGLDDAAAVAWRDMALQYGWTAAQVLLILMGFLVVRYVLGRAIAQPQDDSVEEVFEEIPAATREDMRRHEVSTEIARLAREEPDSVAALLRSWMVQEED
jgi:flagellar M-ring protein FliF